MEMINQLQINNYKSIKQLNLSCSRINVFVGEPNVGKSNILEALDLSYLSWLLHTNNSLGQEKREKINIQEFFRVNSPADLFHKGDLSKPISVHPIGLTADYSLIYDKDENKNVFKLKTGNGSVTEFDNTFTPTENTISNNMFYGSPIHPYKFKEIFEFHDKGNYLNTLMPPYGSNLGTTIRYNPSLKTFVDELAKDKGFEFNIDTSSDKITIQLRVKDGLVYTIPYHALADTFRRILFYVAAIRTNNAFVVTLEEPESHSFPPYISLLADEIIKQEQVQFFIATHSPYLLNNLIENTPEGDLSVFVCGYDKKSFSTTAKKLSSQDLSELLDYGVDIFFNINKYLDDRVEHSS